jgi:hypothetical protein
MAPGKVYSCPWRARQCRQYFITHHEPAFEKTVLLGKTGKFQLKKKSKEPEPSMMMHTYSPRYSGI